MKKYSTFSRYPELESQNQMQLSIILYDTCFLSGEVDDIIYNFTSTEKQNSKSLDQNPSRREKVLQVDKISIHF